MKVKKFLEFLNESSNRMNWSAMKFETKGEEAVADVAEEILLGTSLIVICEGDDIFTQLEQMSSSGDPETALEITGQRLYHYKSPFDFLKWNTIGATPDQILETCFIINEQNLKNFSGDRT